MRRRDDARNRPIPPTPREFMLTFDDGPFPGRTEAVLDALRQLRGEDGKPVRAGFFMVADPPQGLWRRRRHFAPYEMWGRKGSILAYPQLLARARDEGHWVGNHSTRHIWPRWWWYRDAQRLRDELRDWESIAAAAGFSFASQPRLLRTPYLADTHQWRTVAKELDYQLVAGYPVGDSSPDRNAQAIARRVLRIFERHPSEQPVVLIFHDIFPVTFRHLDKIIAILQQHGHRLVHFDVPAPTTEPATVVASA